MQIGDISQLVTCLIFLWNKTWYSKLGTLLYFKYFDTANAIKNPNQKVTKNLTRFFARLNKSITEFVVSQGVHLTNINCCIKCCNLLYAVGAYWILSQKFPDKKIGIQLFIHFKALWWLPHSEVRTRHKCSVVSKGAKFSWQKKKRNQTP